MRKLSLFLSLVVVTSLIFTVSCVSKQVPVTETYYETEYRTEYKTETYTETEAVVVKTVEGKEYLSPVVKWQTGLYFRGSSALMTYYYGYEISAVEHSRSQVKITIVPSALAQDGYILVYNLTGVGQIPPKPDVIGGRASPGPSPKERAWLYNLNAVLANSERILGELDTGIRTQDYIVFDANRITEFAIFANTWVTNSISSAQLVWSDDVVEKQMVTRERQVPYEVPVQVEKQRTVTETGKVPFWEVIFSK